MNRKLILIVIVTIAATLVCNSFCSFADRPTKLVDSSAIEDALLLKIYKLKEVQEREVYLRKLTKGKGKISMIIAERPTNSNPFYLIQVGYINDIRLEIYYNFHINSDYCNRKNIQRCLLIMDTDSEYIKLSKWRLKNRSK